MVKMLDCSLEVSEFELHSYYYIHFQDYYPWEMYELSYPSNYGLNSASTVLLQG